MNETPITDASVMRLALTPELGRFPNGEWVPAGVARQLESELANAYKVYRACNDDLIKLSDEYDKLNDQVMRWFKAASPHATPGSLEEGLKKLRDEVIETCAEECDQYALAFVRSDVPDPENQHRRHAARELAEHIRELKNAAPQDALGGKPPQGASPAGAAHLDSTVKPSAWD